MEVSLAGGCLPYCCWETIVPVRPVCTVACLYNGELTELVMLRSSTLIEQFGNERLDFGEISRPEP